jgi:hypothetical protein
MISKQGTRPPPQQTNKHLEEFSLEETSEMPLILDPLTKGEFSLLPSSTSQAGTTSPTPGECTTVCARARPGTIPRAQSDTAYPGNRRAALRAGGGLQRGRRARGREGGRGGAAPPRAPPPARLHRGAPTCPACLVQRSGHFPPRGPATRRPLLQPARARNPWRARPTPHPLARPQRSPSKLPGLRRLGGAAGKGQPGRGAGREAVGPGRRG